MGNGAEGEEVLAARFPARAERAAILGRLRGEHSGCMLSAIPMEAVNPAGLTDPISEITVHRSAPD
eukprot:12897608-Prorocentrum_lima.AAC.1